MHVDGFRFDLASTLARELHEVDKLGAFFDIIHQDPVLSQVKLIAEPWDLGEGGYQVGNFPGRLVGMERQVSRLRPPLLEGRRRRSSRNSPRASAAAATCTSGAAGGRTPASISSPATTASRCKTWSPTTTSTTKPTAKTTATAPTTTSVGTAAPKGRPTIRQILELARTQETQLPGDAAALAGRAHAAGRRRNGPHAAGQQQRLLPGQRAHLAQLEPLGGTEAAAGVHRTR